MERRTSSACRCTSNPLTWAEPLVAFSNVASMRTVVVLPEPFGPEESNYFPPRNNEVDSVERFDVPELLDQALGLDGVFGHRHERYARRLLSSHRAQPSSTST